MSVRLTLLVALASLLLPGAGWAQGTMPILEGDDLNGTARSFPGGLEGEVNLLIVAFERDQTETINSWLETAERVRVAAPELDYYGIPVLPRGLGLISRLIEGGLRDRYPTSQAREHVVVLYTDAGRLRDSLGIGKGTAVRAVLVDGSGRVLWWRTGAVTVGGEEELLTAVRLARPTTLEQHQ
jgi:hypothetical protein